MGMMYYLNGSYNELDRKGIKKDAANGGDGEKLIIPKVTSTEILKYGEETLEKM